MNKSKLRKSGGPCPYSPPLAFSVDCDACRFYRGDDCRFVEMFSVGISEGKVEALEETTAPESQLTSDEAREIERITSKIEAFCFTEKSTGLFKVSYMKKDKVRIRCFKLPVSDGESMDIVVRCSLLEPILDFVKGAEASRRNLIFEKSFTWLEVAQ